MGSRVTSSPRTLRQTAKSWDVQHCLPIDLTHNQEPGWHCCHAASPEMTSRPNTNTSVCLPTPTPPDVAPNARHSARSRPGAGPQKADVLSVPLRMLDVCYQKVTNGDTITIKCANCGGPHKATAHHCPEFIRACDTMTPHKGNLITRPRPHPHPNLVITTTFPGYHYREIYPRHPGTLDQGYHC